MKIDGSKKGKQAYSFHYNDPLWTNKEPYNPTAGQTGFDNQQTKMSSYWATPFDKLCFGFKVENVLKWAVIPYKASSLYDVIDDGKYRRTTIGREKWLSLIGGSSLQPNCNQEGFNNGYSRIGIKGNDDNHCSWCDSHLGIGTIVKYEWSGGHYSCGNFCQNANWGCKAYTDIPAFVYILIQ